MEEPTVSNPIDFSSLLYNMKPGQQTTWKCECVNNILEKEEHGRTSPTTWIITKVPTGWIFKTGSNEPVFVPLTTYSNPNI